MQKSQNSETLGKFKLGNLNFARFVKVFKDSTFNMYDPNIHESLNKALSGL